MANSVAYCTLVTTDGYVTAALVLAKSLRDTGTRIPLAVLTTPDTVSPRALARLRVLYDVIVEVPPLGGNDDDACAASNLQNLAIIGRPDLAATLTKLHLWSLTRFERVLYLDADTLVLRSLDPLLLTPSGPPGGLAASPELGFPDCFNSGVMLLAPDAGTHAALLRLAARTASFDGGDQGLLNMYFGDGPLAQQQQQQQQQQQGRKGSTGGISDSADSGVALGTGEQEEVKGDRTAGPLGPAQEAVSARPATSESRREGGGGSTWHRLSFTYNIEMHRVYRLYMPAILRYRDEHKVLHFIGKDKPWHFADGVVDTSKDPSPYSRFYADMVARWWQVRRTLPEGADEALSA